MSFRESLKRFIQDNLAQERSLKIEDDFRLIEQGILDSMSMVELIGFIEQESGLRVPDHEVVPDNFRTLSAIEDMVQRLRSGNRA